MNTPIAPQELNPDIVRIISDLVWESVEHDDEQKLWLVEFNAAIAAASKHITTEQLRTLENAPWALAVPYGYDMFKLGLQIGLDPMTLLTLAQGEHIR